MPSIANPETETFVDRRQSAALGSTTQERRQFANSYDSLSPDAQELALAIDQYKLRHRRRFINFEEMLAIVTTPGYSK